MMRLLQSYWPSSLALMLGALLAVGMTPVILSTAHWYTAWHSENNPPATLQWSTIERLDPDSLRITLLVTRHDDCQMLRLLGYTGVSLQAMIPADSLGRADGRPPQDYPVGITVVSRPWLLRGIFGDKIAIAAYYDCADTIVKAPLLIGDVPALP